MTLRKAAEMALELLENHVEDARCEVSICKTVAALRQALSNEFNPDWNQVEALQESLREHMAEIQRLRQAIAESEQKPVAWLHELADGHRHCVTKDESGYVDNFTDTYKTIPLYTAPPKREWVELTEEDWKSVSYTSDNFIAGAAWAEAKLKEKNT